MLPYDPAWDPTHPSNSSYGAKFARTKRYPRGKYFYPDESDFADLDDGDSEIPVTRDARDEVIELSSESSEDDIVRSSDGAIFQTSSSAGAVVLDARVLSTSVLGEKVEPNEQTCLFQKPFADPFVDNSEVELDATQALTHQQQNDTTSAALGDLRNSEQQLAREIDLGGGETCLPPTRVLCDPCESEEQVAQATAGPAESIPELSTVDETCSSPPHVPTEACRSDQQAARGMVGSPNHLTETEAVSSPLCRQVLSESKQPFLDSAILEISNVSIEPCSPLAHVTTDRSRTTAATVDLGNAEVAQSSSVVSPAQTQVDALKGIGDTFSLLKDFPGRWPKAASSISPGPSSSKRRALSGSELRNLAVAPLSQRLKSANTGSTRSGSSQFGAFVIGRWCERNDCVLCDCVACEVGYY